MGIARPGGTPSTAMFVFKRHVEDVRLQAALPATRVRRRISAKLESTGPWDGSRPPHSSIVSATSPGSYGDFRRFRVSADIRAGRSGAGTPVGAADGPRGQSRGRSCDISWDRNDVDLPWGQFVTNLGRTRVSYSFSSMR